MTRFDFEMVYCLIHTYANVISSICPPSVVTMEQTKARAIDKIILKFFFFNLQLSFEPKYNTTKPLVSSEAFSADRELGSKVAGLLQTNLQNHSSSSPDSKGQRTQFN